MNYAKKITATVITVIRDMLKHYRIFIVACFLELVLFFKERILL